MTDGTDQPALILMMPHGAIIATSLGVEGLAWHRSPGSGKHFLGRSIFFELAVRGDRPDFKFFDEGGWRDPMGDTIAAIAAARTKRTKTALSNNAFSATPVDAYRRAYLVKTEGHALELESGGEVARFRDVPAHEGLTPDQIAAAAGLQPPAKREPRLYAVFAPVEFLMLSNLTPAEYAWYATHRPGKVFRQVLFADVRQDHEFMAAQSVYGEARAELQRNANKKTKTIIFGDCINSIPFNAWCAYDRRDGSGLWAADRSHMTVWRFPERIPTSWDKANG